MCMPKPHPSEGKAPLWRCLSFKWWHRQAKDVLVQQGIEPQPGPRKPEVETDTDQRLHIVSRNIRGIYTNLANVIRTRADVVCIQEMDICEAEVRDFQAQAAVANYSVYFANKTPLTKDSAGPWGAERQLW